MFDISLDTNQYYDGYPVRIATRRWQKRTHRKHRINKKWAKKYGYYEINFMPHNEAILVNGFLYMTRQTFDRLRKEYKKYARLYMD